MNRRAMKWTGLAVAIQLLAMPGCTATQPVLTAAPTDSIANGQTAARQRLLPLEGGQNFRDLGGYAGADGRTVRWGVLFRSGSMHGLTAHDFATLGDIGLKTVVDLRTNDERRMEPVAWPESMAPHVLTKDYSLVMDPVMRAFAKPDLKAEDVRSAMVSGYRGLPFQLADQYRAIFAELKAAHAPLAFNCTAGKDRTGLAAALVLTALGVDRETVISDFLLSNEYYRPKPPTTGQGDPRAAMFASLSPEIVKALMGVDRSYIEAAFAAIEAEPGGLDAYFRDQLDVSDGDIARLRAAYLQ